MEIKIVLDTGGAAAAGVDRDALIANIQAELDKITSDAGATPVKPKKKAPPGGAQGDLAAIQWLVDIATNPAMAKLYAQGLIMAINAILKVAKSKEAEGKKTADPSTEKAPVQISVSGEKIALPAATSVIKAILDKIGDE
ncbi:hypothetical protein X769_22580 [Mesorhizobium sp. LSJC268A00]|uniref:hypothetical protein n=1 Tax=unclassified Mesorhizobium TaxID=325217 RepID=UPI0003CED155|nr:hypothetical protein [Mesorhizobium sp. LSJC268A00]ESX00684.1 hypothetical protein X769_22580 [Mesorhizobium sp. LSJC268A00]